MKNRRSKIAAFFDLDGTLVPLPSLEQRFFRVLRERGEIPLKNYFSWLCEAVRLLPCGTDTAAHANKMYLEDVLSFDQGGRQNGTTPPVENGGRASERSASRDEGQPSAPPSGNPRWTVPRFFEKGLERVAWHGQQGHAIVVVSGTLEPLAANAARALEGELRTRGVAEKVRVCATKLEEMDGRWTGRILGEAMFGRAKARAVRALGEEIRLDLSQCWAYGDSAADRWLLAAVGNPVAVNPAPPLRRMAGNRGWPILRMTTRPQEMQPGLLRAERWA
jgi:phosphoserine phosphatase